MDWLEKITSSWAWVRVRSGRARWFLKMCSWISDNESMIN